ncbi:MULTISPECIES: DUF5690 family protein [Reichenbachiella]|uniref:Major Facilitator Superfamily protein n=1 Tax=Reichenbachiella agariperforans TaxID=156994 RepID=A0A1M6V3Q9_REIAG|nr:MULTISPECIES: DUF5690 family protein [Reichenbachiella]MBU2912929.1 hypothetical protein [Reichenbachiella agariperforans]SHK76132.1 hypothetical protein SAMN04488028_108110 [Reichenbachiella agariperforans]
MDVTLPAAFSQKSKNAWFLVISMGLVAFSTYSCMYAFRKAFSVGVFADVTYLGLEFKSLLIIAQALGYMFSKFIGIKFISELKKSQRAWLILALIGFAELALVLFAFIPAPYNFWCLFLNGLPLGMIWGIVFSYLEGRSSTEILGAILSISFIMASNLCKSVAQWLIINLSVSEYHMPYIVGLIFTVPLLVSVYLLNKMPEPTEEDKAERMARVPMDAASRRTSLKSIGGLMLVMVLSYMMLTIFRDLRSNYASDIWLALGFAEEPSIYLSTSIPSTIIVLIVMSSIFLIRDNFKALLAIQLIILVGYVTIALSTFGMEQKVVSGSLWVIMIMTGVYLAYIPFNCFVFERVIPVFKISGANIGFLMYIADAFGYLGSVGVLLFKNFYSPNVDWLDFIVQSAYVVAVIGIVMTGFTVVYLLRKIRIAN